MKVYAFLGETWQNWEEYLFSLHGDKNLYFLYLPGNDFVECLLLVIEIRNRIHISKTLINRARAYIPNLSDKERELRVCASGTFNEGVVSINARWIDTSRKFIIPVSDWEAEIQKALQKTA